MGVLVLTGKHGDTHIVPDYQEPYYNQHNSRVPEEMRFRIKEFKTEEEAIDYISGKHKAKSVTAPKPAGKPTGKRK